jgi:hypothetical protein
VTCGFADFADFFTKRLRVTRARARESWLLEIRKIRKSATCMTVDTDSLLSYVDLLSLAERDTALRHVASTNGGEYAGPCPFCGGRDRFRVQPNASPRPIWYCRQCGGGRWHDALDYVARRESLDLKRADDFRRACELLGAVDTLPHRERPPAPPAPDAGPPSVEWQAAARHVIEETVTSLWSSAGDRARAWLHARGLNDVTLRRWRIGYCAGSGYRDIAGLSVPCGIVIPCEIAGNIWYLKVRRASGEPKYIHVKGGRPALFGADTLRGHAIAVICEGEFDALLLHQQAGDPSASSGQALCGVATVGSAGGNLDVTAWAAHLLPLRRLLLAYDMDDAGKKGAAKLAGLTARARRLTLPVLPGVKDLTDFHKAGGNLRDWLAFELARLELTLPHTCRDASQE